MHFFPSPAAVAIGTEQSMKNITTTTKGMAGPEIDEDASWPEPIVLVADALLFHFLPASISGQITRPSA
jgi:hypothetical protein